MKAKGCISEVLEWPTAREFFYWRIRRRQAEDPLKDRLVAASNGALTLDAAAERVSVYVLPIPKNLNEHLLNDKKIIYHAKI